MYRSAYGLRPAASMAAPSRANSMRSSISMHSGARARQNVAVRPIGVADADVSERIDHAFARQDAVRGHEIIERRRRCTHGGLQDNMNGMTKRLKTALATRGHTEAPKDGTVKPGSVDFEFEAVP